MRQGFQSAMVDKTILMNPIIRNFVINIGQQITVGVWKSYLQKLAVDQIRESQTILYAVEKGGHGAENGTLFRLRQGFMIHGDHATGSQKPNTMPDRSHIIRQMMNDRIGGNQIIARGKPQFLK